MIAMSNFSNTLFWAVLIGWILSVVLHEFAHGLVAYWGGDYTIRERGGLTLNPLQYVDPMFSIVLPIIFLFMGGIPLPGGSTYIRRDLLRSRSWDSAVSLAGPFTNLLLFVGCAIPLLPRFGWLVPGTEPTQAQYLLGALAFLQIVTVVLNLVPVPPLDGFQALSPWLPADLRRTLTTPPWSTGLFIGFFVIVWKLHVIGFIFDHIAAPALGAMGFDAYGQFFFIRAFIQAFSS